MALQRFAHFKFVGVVGGDEVRADEKRMTSAVRSCSAITPCHLSPGMIRRSYHLTISPRRSAPTRSLRGRKESEGDVPRSIRSQSGQRAKSEGRRVIEVENVGNLVSSALRPDVGSFGAHAAENPIPLLMRRRFTARQTRCHSALVFRRPRRLNCRNPRTPLIHPKTGSTMTFLRR